MLIHWSLHSAGACWPTFTLSHSSLSAIVEYLTLSSLVITDWIWSSNASTSDCFHAVHQQTVSRLNISNHPMPHSYNAALRVLTVRLSVCLSVSAPNSKTKSYRKTKIRVDVHQASGNRCANFQLRRSKVMVMVKIAQCSVQINGRPHNTLALGRHIFLVTSVRK